jgi:predicted transcriptional regulator
MTRNPVLAKEIMVTKLVTLSPSMDAFEAIDLLLKYRISGAPVVDPERNYLGVFSERCCMSLLVEGAYQQLPSIQVYAYMDTHAQTIDEDMDLLSIAQIFLNTHARRLPVLDEGKLVGQISRRDVLKAIHAMSAVTSNEDSALLYLSSLVERNNAPIS